MKLLTITLLSVLAAVGVYMARHRIMFALKTGGIVYVGLIFGRLFVSLITGGAKSEPIGEFVWPVVFLVIAWAALWWVSTNFAQRRDREKRFRRAPGAGRAGR
jgi:hypothetical protein